MNSTHVDHTFCNVLEEHFIVLTVDGNISIDRLTKIHDMESINVYTSEWNWLISCNMIMCHDWQVGNCWCRGLFLEHTSEFIFFNTMWAYSISGSMCPCATLDVVCFGSQTVPGQNECTLYLENLLKLLIHILKCPWLRDECCCASCDQNGHLCWCQGLLDIWGKKKKKVLQ